MMEANVLGAGPLQSEPDSLGIPTARKKNRILQDFQPHNYEEVGMKSIGDTIDQSYSSLHQKPDTSRLHSDRSSSDGFKQAYGYSSRMNYSSNVASVKPTSELPDIRAKIAQD